MQDSGKNNKEKPGASTDPLSPERFPRITGIQKPFELILNSLDDILKKGSYWEELKEILDSCRTIVEIQLKHAESLPELSVITNEIVRERFDGNTPALRKENFLVYESEFTPLVKDILLAMGAAEPDTETLGDDLLKRFIGNAGELLDEIIESTNIDDETLLIGLNSAYQVFLVNAAAQIRDDFEQDVWENGFCPICGTGPEMGRISTRDGHYYLSCALCFTEWTYPRIGCPFCGNDNHSELAYFEAEEYKGYRVNICRKCNSYIKATIEDDLNRRHIPVLDALYTLELDSSATSEGFHHGEISFSGIDS